MCNSFVFVVFSPPNQSSSSTPPHWTPFLHTLVLHNTLLALSTCIILFCSVLLCVLLHLFSFFSISYSISSTILLYSFLVSYFCVAVYLIFYFYRLHPRSRSMISRPTVYLSVYCWVYSKTRQQDKRTNTRLGSYNVMLDECISVK